LTTCTS